MVYRELFASGMRRKLSEHLQQFYFIRFNVHIHSKLL